MQVVLLGVVGSGKTTLFNRITEADEKTCSSMTTTRNVTSKLSAQCSPKFNVLDTPGFGTSQEKIVHVAGIITALTECPVNRIIVTIRFRRIDEIVDQFCDVLKHIDTYAHLITIVVTSWDLSYNSKREGLEKELREIFQRKFNQTSIIFTSNKESGNETCQKIIQEIANSKAEQIIISPDMVFQKFLVCEMTEYNYYNLVNLEVKLYMMIENRFRKAKQDINRLITEKQKADLLAPIYFNIKQQALEALDKFEIENYRDFCELEFLGKMIVHNRFKQVIVKELDWFLQYLKQKLIKNKTQCITTLGQEEIVCPSETTQKWKDKVKKCQQQYQLLINEEIEKQKQQRKSL